MLSHRPADRHRTRDENRPHPQSCAKAAKLDGVVSRDVRCRQAATAIPKLCTNERPIVRHLGSDLHHRSLKCHRLNAIAKTGSTVDSHQTIIAPVTETDLPTIPKLPYSPRSAEFPHGARLEDGLLRSCVFTRQRHSSVRSLPSTVLMVILFHASVMRHDSMVLRSARSCVGKLLQRAMSCL